MENNANQRQKDAADQIAGDRREDRRYPIELELKYKLIRRRRVLDNGVGKTLNISSGGIFFESDRPLPVGLNVELSITWPVLLHSVAPMRLQVSGRLVRGERNRLAVRTVQHEFRTQGTAQRVEPPAPARATEHHPPLGYFFQPARVAGLGKQ